MNERNSNASSFDDRPQIPNRDPQPPGAGRMPRAGRTWRVVVPGRIVAKRYADSGGPIRDKTRRAECAAGSIPEAHAESSQRQRSPCGDHQTLCVDSGGQPGVDGGVSCRPRAHRAGERSDVYVPAIGRRRGRRHGLPDEVCAMTHDTPNRRASRYDQDTPRTCDAATRRSRGDPRRPGS